jgi:hypothetical protein
MILYIPNATLNQYVLLSDRFAFIEGLEYIELKLDTNTQFCKENSIDGETSILALIKEFKEKLQSLKHLILTIREKDFKFISESMKR